MSEMSNEDKLLRMFHLVNPDFKNSRTCTVQVEECSDWSTFDDDRVDVYKNGNKCWGYTKSELLFEYATMAW